MVLLVDACEPVVDAADDLAAVNRAGKPLILALNKVDVPALNRRQRRK
jgi:predicted GTPase